MMLFLQTAVIGGLLAAMSFLVWKYRCGARYLAPGQRRRLESLDRVILTHHHSVHLVRVEGRWMALGVTPKGIELLESGDFVMEDSCTNAATESKVFSTLMARFAKGSTCGS